MSTADKQTAENRIGAGKAGPGRPAGTPNRITNLVKDAIIHAAEVVGSDGNGKDGLAGYLEAIARNEPRSFTQLLGRVLPMQVEAAVAVEHRSKEQRDAAIAAFMRADT